MDGGWQSFDVHEEKSLDCCKGTIGRNVGVKVASGIRKKRKAVEKSSICLENTQIIRNRMLVEMWTLKAISMRNEKEMRKTSLETGEKEILDTRQRT